MQRIRTTVQDYSTYTTKDFYVWRLLYERQLPSIQAHASQLYLDALDKIGFNASEIPHFDKTTKLLQQYTGWQLAVVPGLVPETSFFEMLANKTFPATCWLRTLEEMDYIEEPDIFHDVLGHVPLLVNSAYATFLHNFGQLAMKWIDTPNAIHILAHVYWFTIEFGLLRENGKNKIFGAAIISSRGEMENVYKAEIQKACFNIREMFNTEHNFSNYQSKYFVLDSFEQLCHALPLIDEQMEQMLSSQLIPNAVSIQQYQTENGIIQ
jgi:phenylalanine-4-hydroxylase